MKLYLGGPMSGIPQLNHPAFDRAAERLRALGHIVHSPAEHTRELCPDVDFSLLTGFEHDSLPVTRRQLLRMDLEWICDESDANIVIPGWSQSSGSVAEVATALALPIPVWRYRGFIEHGTDAARVTLTYR